jgi:hypothetical protein
MSDAEAFEAEWEGNCGRGAAKALEWVVAVVAVAPLQELVAATGVDGERRFGEC